MVDAVEVLVHSLAEVHRPRGIRINLVTTPARLAGGVEGVAVDPATDLAATVSMLLAADTALTSAVIPLGSGH